MNEPTPRYSVPDFPLWVRQALLYLLIAALIFGVTLLSPVLPMLAIAFLIAFLLFRPARALSDRTFLSYPGAVAILYLLLLIVLGVVLVLIIPPLIQGANSLINTLREFYVSGLEALQNFNISSAVFDIFGFQIDLRSQIAQLQTIFLGASGSSAFLGTQPFNPPATFQAPDVNAIVNQALSVFGSLTTTLTAALGGVTVFFANLLLALFISFLILLDIPSGERTLVRTIPTSFHREFALVINQIVRIWNGFFRGQVSIGFIIGGLTFIQLQLMGIPNSQILAVVVGVISLIPTIGGLIALGPLAIVPLVQGSRVFTELSPVTVMLLVVVGNLIISQIIWNVVAPTILGDVLDLPLAVIIVGVFVGAAVGGILGAFLIAPVLATLRVILSYTWDKINQRDPFPGQEAPYSWDAEGRRIDAKRSVDSKPQSAPSGTQPESA